ncbi:rhodanese-related sulfurtransferase [Verrucomicrobiaceae bacterium R5-34]|uniref:tRNA uridine(34) hydroxylase n=1 Tax=Oceaniferula flava TaxID=2800421 RepID=A0AAE2SB57_9BACT|nr:rhodanese-related sulfurtransferase [Oceaniferula flavus]MBK1830387.1 rhodanese-related sulfurtransferase [Verrucomicrobiaceae bacterium R5-34]MBK1854479.1 rhodanese-related sulfurtransferase [Oceaniferula flavus]MBM1135785.1 rhodanese-related sulfurtransferase [Oceaniferula flavus]
MEQPPFLVLLYYLYTDIEDPELYRDQQRALCEELGLFGRIIVAKEGINGTLSGPRSACEAYIEAMHADPRTAAMTFKIDEEQDHVFPKLSVKARDEIVTLGLGDEDISPNEYTGKHLTPKEWKEEMENPEAVILDARNDYEYDLGHFKGAIRPDIGNFKELPEWIKEHREELDGKKILTYCTGGIRCEKFSGFLVKEGFEDVNQLLGGIVEYGKDPEARGENYDGECYVFDQRVGVPVNHVNPSTVSHCIHCGEESSRYVNCAYPPCNDQHFCCEKCEPASGRYCCEKCRDAAAAAAS